MKTQNHYKKEVFIDGEKTSYRQLMQIFTIAEATARNLFKFELDDVRIFRGRKLSYRWIKLHRTFNINGRITDDYAEVTRWLGLTYDTLYTYLSDNPRGWVKNSNHVTFTEEWREVDYWTLDRKKRGNDNAPLIAKPAQYDVIEYKGVKIVRRIIDGTLDKTYGWSVGREKLGL